MLSFPNLIPKKITEIQNMNNEEILKEIFLVRNHDPKTQKIYRRAINHYCNFHQMTMEELIDEAEAEENKPWKKRKLKKRLLSFRHHLIDKYKKNTVNAYFSPIITVYRYYEIEIWELTKPNQRSYNIPGKPTFDELPTHEEIAQVIHSSKLWFQAAILFMTSSGCARKETMNLTVGQFKKATQPFHNKNTILEALNTLKELDDVIPTFKLKREKTNKYYYTFCSPEAVQKIVEYLLTDRTETLENGNIKLINLADGDRIFNVSEDYFLNRFSRCNDHFQFGKAGDGFNRFRSHMMRKFHSNHLKKSGMSESDIDALQGRTKSSTRAAYFLDDPKILLKKYVEHYPCLLIESKVNNIDWKSVEYKELEAKYKQKEAEVMQMNDRISSIEEKLIHVEEMSWSNVLDKMGKQR